MSAYLVVSYNVPDIEVFKSGIKVPYTLVDHFKTKSDIDVFVRNSRINKGGFNTVGLAFHNKEMKNVIFGEEDLDKDGVLFEYFLESLSHNGVKVVDLISCYINTPEVKNHLEKLEKKYRLDIRYSLDATGYAGEGGDWHMESDSVDIKNIYFNNKISEYKTILGQISAFFRHFTNIGISPVPVETGC
jgi:hypothetical protein